MLLFIIASTAISTTFKYNYEFGLFHDVTLEDPYDRALFTLPAGEGLMMVDWEDAILSISVPGISQKNALLTKHSGFSVFLFDKDASIDIIFHKKMSFSVFCCPYLESSDGAKQFISNYAKNEIGLNTGRDVYFKVFKNYDMSGSLSTSALTTAELIYFTNNNQYNTKNLKNINLQNLGNHALFSVVGFGELKGTLYLNCKPEFNPTVPTLVELNIDGKIKQNKNNYKQTIAYGGTSSKGDAKQMTFSDVVNTQYVTISNNIENYNYYYLYAKDKDGNYKLIKPDDPYIETKSYNFKVEVYIRSAMGLENCSDYVYVTEFDSSQLAIADFDISYKQIKEEHIPNACYYHDKNSNKGGNKNGKKIGIIVGVVVAVVVVIIIVIVVVVVVIKKRKSDKSSHEGQLETNTEQA
ncbi:hypothetical protein M9Y10_018599 [Tritrichomonas musculus]|uniref:Uncharacterized protein n=1 Tax=Tritrichomonas musculus TaxID=1915356 RepID=A0ABR2HN13_9EUKA